jgi:hypothetical protein
VEIRDRLRERGLSVGYGTIWRFLNSRDLRFNAGEGEGNRTLVVSLGSRSSSPASPINPTKSMSYDVCRCSMMHRWCPKLSQTAGLTASRFGWQAGQALSHAGMGDSDSQPDAPECGQPS